ncbi:hypothetical protein LXL04_038678 [Taraxacum kok-saghyz]
MDNLYGINDSKLPKRSSMSPVQNFGTQNPYYHYNNPVIDQYPSPDVHTTSIKNPNSPLLRYLQSDRSLMATPSSIGYKYNRSNVTRASQNSPRLEPSHRSSSPSIFRNTAVKVEEDVLVMDGVVVKNPPVDRARSSSSSLTDSGGSSSSSSSSPGVKNYKLDLCLSYMENSGFCRYGPKCQFAHGNKELRASQFSYKNTHEAPCKNYSITTSSTTPIKVDELTRNFANLKTSDWNPLDDGIDMGDNLTKEEVHAVINKFINGPEKWKRLPVFTAICPE